LRGDEIRHRASRLDARPPRLARFVGRRDETSPDQLVQRILSVDGGEPGDWRAAPRDHDLGTLLDSLEMLAQPIVKLPNPDIVASLM
jgi:hypothetical protein